MNELSLENKEIDLLLSRKLSDKETILNVLFLLDRLGGINFLLSMFEEFIHRSPEILENMNETIIEFREKTTNQKQNRDIKQLIELAGKIQEILLSKEVQEMINAVYSAVKTYNPEKQSVGMVGAIRCMSDKDIQKSIGLIFHILREVGKNLNHSNQGGK